MLTDRWEGVIAITTGKHAGNYMKPVEIKADCHQPLGMRHRAFRRREQASTHSEKRRNNISRKFTFRSKNSFCLPIYQSQVGFLDESGNLEDIAGEFLCQVALGQGGATRHTPMGRVG